MTKCKALLIGINYTGTASALRGCINDVHNVQQYLQERFDQVNIVHLPPLEVTRVSDTDNAVVDVSDVVIEPDSPPSSRVCCGLVRGEKVQQQQRDLPQQGPPTSVPPGPPTSVDVVILTDDQQGWHYPNKRNILHAIEWLVQDADADTHMFFHYSGHGSHQRDLNGDEEDGQDESLVPVDYRTAGMLVDDDLRHHLVDPLPAGCQLHMVLDCCHSGSGCDMPYSYRDEDALRGMMDPTYNHRVSESKCTVVSWSGCMDNQTSADAFINGTFAGALTNTFLELMRDPNQDKNYAALYAKLLQEIRRRGYTQRPQLAAGRRVDLTRSFDFF